MVGDTGGRTPPLKVTMALNMGAGPPEAMRPRLTCDAPQDQDHLVPGLMISGWALSTVGIHAVRVSLAGHSLGVAEYGLARPDVAADHGADPASLYSGYRLRLDTIPTTIGPGPVALVVTAEDHAGQQTAVRRLLQVQIEPPPADTDYSGPDFVIIGAQRAGTTSLYHYLTAHPRVAPAARKELHFFTQYATRGIAWYRSQFPHDQPNEIITGEATPYYLFHPHVARRLAACCPATKLIVLLRNPVDRAYSHYQLEVRLGNEPLSFEDALAQEDERLAGEPERMLADEQYQSFNHQHFSYLARGRYADQLQRWFDLVPRDRLFILKSEDLYHTPSAVVRRVTDRLALPPVDLTDRRAYNNEPYAPMHPATRAWLERHFHDANQELRDLLNDDRWRWRHE